MRWLEVRRHSLTKKGAERGRGSHLSAAGVSLARTVGAQRGPFAYTLTSDSPRAVETAIAMGSAVDDTAEMPSCYVPGEVGQHEQWRWPRPYDRYARLIAAGTGLRAAVAVHQSLWIRAVQTVAEGAAALVVSHGGSIEPTLVACLPDADHAAWGGLFSHCDGVYLGFDGGQFVTGEILRAPRAALSKLCVQ
jgi:broad specificity phosphatase PhoE